MKVDHSAVLTVAYWAGTTDKWWVAAKAALLADAMELWTVAMKVGYWAVKNDVWKVAAMVE